MTDRNLYHKILINQKIYEQDGIDVGYHTDSDGGSYAYCVNDADERRLTENADTTLDLIMQAELNGYVKKVIESTPVQRGYYVMCEPTKKWLKLIADGELEYDRNGFCSINIQTPEYVDLIKNSDMQYIYKNTIPLSEETMLAVKLAINSEAI